jgi:hypothetical protein
MKKIAHIICCLFLLSNYATASQVLHFKDRESLEHFYNILEDADFVVERFGNNLAIYATFEQRKLIEDLIKPYLRENGQNPQAEAIAKWKLPEKRPSEVLREQRLAKEKKHAHKKNDQPLPSAQIRKQKQEHSTRFSGHNTKNHSR